MRRGDGCRRFAGGTQLRLTQKRPVLQLTLFSVAGLNFRCWCGADLGNSQIVFMCGNLPRVPPLSGCSSIRRLYCHRSFVNREWPVRRSTWNCRRGDRHEMPHRPVAGYATRRRP
jgi:hypothetical protein